MESILIWGLALGLGTIIITIYLKKTNTYNAAFSAREEAVRLGADKAIAQHPQINALACIACGSCIAACPEGDVLGMVQGKATVINGLKCVGHGKCAEACPVGGITVGLGDVSGRKDLPVLDENYQSSLPGVYITGELGGLALIRNAINQGCLAMEHIARTAVNNSSPELLDVVIVGAGPAGMSASLKAVECRLSYLLIDEQSTGGTILQYPRKKLVMTRPVEIPLYGTLTKPEYTKEELLQIWDSILKKFQVKVHQGEKLNGLKKIDGYYQVITDKASYSARNIVLALGRRGTPKKLGIPGEELSKVMYKLLDASLHNQEHILVVGGGDSAIEAAIGLARQKGNTVTISYRKEKFFRIKKLNQQRLDEQVASRKINVLYNSEPVQIKADFAELSLPEGRQRIANDYVYIFAGGEPPFGLLREIGIKFN